MKTQPREPYKPTSNLSNSRLATVSECEYKYYLRYFKKYYPNRESSWFKFGKLVHESIEDFLTTEEVLSYESLVAFFENRIRYIFGAPMLADLRNHRYYYENACKTVIEEGRKKYGREYTRPILTKRFQEEYQPFLDGLEASINTNAEKAVPEVIFRKPLTELYVNSIKCLSNFYKLEQEAKPNYVEVRSEFKIEPAYDFCGDLISGIVDRIEFDANGDYTIGDYKTGVSAWDDTKVVNSDQLQRYALALKPILGRYPKKLQIWDLFRGEIVSYPFDEMVIPIIESRLLGAIGAKKRLDQYITSRTEGQPLHFNVPAGNETDKCKRCDYAEDTGMPCKYFLQVKEEKK